ncbi:MAG TPA: glycosyltransferase [Steroidobacteraceae bacterium]|jgi:glycosyltransferase involved in cell wall biosynthesis|nr:glycosyltransferase [Steroidobacteraceae bacterium]
MPCSAPARLLFIVNSLDFGGAEKQLVTLLNHLDPERFRMYLAYLKPGASLRPQLREERLARVLCCSVRRWIDPRAVAQLRSLIATEQIDAVICTNQYSMLYGYLARGARAGTRLATVFHSTLLYSYKEKAQMLLYRRLFRRCDLLLYVCENQRRHWRGRGLRAAADAVVYNGIDSARYTDSLSSAERLKFRRSLGVGDDEYLIGLCSVLRPEKAHADLLAAIARLRARGIPAKALLIGDGPERALIEQAAARLGITSYVRITGFEPDVRPFIAACDVMTLVSHDETFSIAALESMALGKPLVMSDVGGAREQVIHGEQGFLFPAGDLDSLTTCLATLTAQPLRLQFGEAAARRARGHFSVQSMTSRFTSCMDNLLDRERIPADRTHPQRVRST